MEKLELIAAQIGIPSAPIILADVKNDDSLIEMAQKAKVVIDCVGPFRLYGEPVVRACVTAGTDYIDICGEPEYIERIEYEYGTKAKEQGCYVASAVGFDSVPGDVGALWTASLFIPPARCTSIETFISIRGGPSGFRGHFPTYESAVYGFASAGELSALRKKATAARGGRVDLKIPGPRPKIDVQPQYDGRVDAWRLPFMGSDASVVRRTATALAQAGLKAYNCAVYLTLPSRWDAAVFGFFGGVFSYLAKKEWGRKLLLAFPRLFSFGYFSHAGPSPQQMAEASFEMRNFASGYSQGAPGVGEGAEATQRPDLHITTRVAGPEPGYMACSIFIVAAAVTMVEERKKLPKEGGVYTPAFLLKDTTYIDRLKARGIAFEQITLPLD